MTPIAALKVGLCAALFLAGCSRPAERSTDYFGASDSTSSQLDSIWIAAKESVRSNLDDTIAARFPDRRHITIWDLGTGHWKVFGFVASRNSLGEDRIVPFVVTVGSYRDGSGFFTEERILGTARERQQSGLFKRIDSLAKVLQP